MSEAFPHIDRDQTIVLGAGSGDTPAFPIGSRCRNV
jgi:hypothetical protein